MIIITSIVYTIFSVNTGASSHARGSIPTGDGRRGHETALKCRRPMSPTHFWILDLADSSGNTGNRAVGIIKQAGDIAKQYRPDPRARMTITPEVRKQLFGPDGKRVVQLPPRTSAATGTSSAEPASTASNAGYHHQTGYMMAMAALAPAPIAVTPAMTHGLPWTAEEHARFILGLEQYPAGPWKLVAAIVGSRDARQTMSHAQKYRMTIQRRKQKKEKQQQRKQQRQRYHTPSTSATSTSTDGDDGRPQAASEIAISTTGYAAHSMQQAVELDLSDVSAALSMGGDAAFTMSNVVEDKFDQRASARMSPLAFDTAPMAEMTAELHEFLCSGGNSATPAFNHSYESHIE